MQLLIGDTDYHLDREERLVRSMLRHQPRCIALTGSRQGDATRTLLRRSGVPVVEMWDAPSDPIDAAVDFSNVNAARDGALSRRQGASADQLHRRRERARSA